MNDRPPESLGREILRRRIPQVVGVYLAAGWGLLEFTDWAVNRFDWATPITDLVVGGWLLLLPLVLVAAWRLGRPRGQPQIVPSTETPRSVAVLPFANWSESPDNEYLSDGITDEIINALTRVEGLKVVSRTTAFAYKGRSEDVRAIGRELNVGSVLEGSVKLAGNRLRITTQLVDVDRGFHLWSEHYDRELEDLFAIEDEIAENVVRALRLILREDQPRTPSELQTTDVRAYEYYLRGRQFFHQWRRKSLEYAMEMYRRAIELDPEYALAYTGVANAGGLHYMYYPTTDTLLREADEASLRALELDPDLAEGHAARGLVLFLMKQFDDAENAFQTAIRLDPKLFEAHYFYGRCSFQQGRLAEAAQAFEKASQVREDYQAAFFAAQSREALGEEAKAGAGYRRALELTQKHMELNPDDPQREEGVVWAERAVAIDPEDAGVCYNVACLYALEGMTDKAIHSLERAARVGFGNRDWIANDPDLESLRGHPRFEALLESM
jgi:TolB-like protein/Tfp pilus assembly protein PilF